MRYKGFSYLLFYIFVLPGVEEREGGQVKDAPRPRRPFAVASTLSRKKGRFANPARVGDRVATRTEPGPGRGLLDREGERGASVYCTVH